ncbi:hypothetical protein GCM10007901_19780 [Dyella acidisoli]|uniref:Uncharacterized protein n=2 Tax=Dyella acidisoli TaxID=1867834 RepID=A0ABQ5XNT9_9GAMM|nr:hypothetical protein GCM10007901_19780 [Dyella acidisoli]
MSSHDAAGFQGKKIAVTRYQTPDFNAVTVGRAAFGLIGAAAMISAGNALVKENDVHDPAPVLGLSLAEKIASAYSAKVIVNPDVSVAKNDKIQTIIEVYKGADLLLDARTFAWQFVYYPTDWSHYRVNYVAKARLIDVPKKKVVAQAMCQTTQGDDKKPPTKDQLLANQAALLKEYLDKARLACDDLLSKELFGLGSSELRAAAP